MSFNVVYHYCSLDTFNLIISNKTLRVSDISKSNDSEELKWISNKISSTVINCIIRDKILCQKYNIDDEKINIIKSRLKRTTDSVFVNNSRNMISLACCFSEVGDLLSQWRGNANDGNGVSIGFNKEILMRLNSYSFSYKFYKVEYNNQNQINFIERYIDDVIKSYVQVDSEEITDTTYSEFLQDLISRTAALFNEAPAFKNKCFYEEKEWRICIKTFLRNVIADDKYINNEENNIGFSEEEFNYPAMLSNGLNRLPISFSVKDNKLIPYVDLDFSDIKNELINKIIIGPKCDVSALDINFC